jgi:hypothetical protein
MSDPDNLLTLADALVASLTAAFTGIDVAWVADPTIELSDEDLAASLVWVVDLHETIDGSGDGGAFEEFGLLIVVQAKLNPRDADFTLDEQTRIMSAMVHGISRHIRPLTGVRYLAVGDNAAFCTKIERKPRDLADMNEKHRFYVEMVTHWRMH